MLVSETSTLLDLDTEERERNKEEDWEIFPPELGEKRNWGPESCIALYLKDIGRFSLLNPQEEKTLTKQLAKINQLRLQSEEEIRNASAELTRQKAIKKREKLEEKYQAVKKKIVEANLRLVISIAAQYRNAVAGRMSFSDLIQEGNIGLMEGIDNFDPEKGCRLSTYVWWWIFQTMMRAIAKQSHTIRLPINYEGEEKKFLLAQAKLQEEDEAVTPETLAQEMNLSLKTVQRMFQVQGAKYLTSFNFLLPRDENQKTELGDFIPHKDPLPDEEAIVKITTEEIVAVMDKCLKPREKEILIRYFGLDHTPSETLEVIGQSLNLTRERVRQIKDEALRKLRHYFRMQDIDFGHF